MSDKYRLDFVANSLLELDEQYQLHNIDDPYK